MTRPRANICTEYMREALRWVPVYPKEISLKGIAEKMKVDNAKVQSIVSGLPVDMPIAERSEPCATYLCFPTQRDKRRAIGRRR